MKFSKQFIKVVDGEIERDILTDYQLDIILGSSDKDYYSQDGVEYYRIYYREIENPRYDMLYSYDHYTIEPNSKAICEYTADPLPQEEVEKVKEKQWEIVRAQRNNCLVESDTESGILLLDLWNSKSEEYRQAWLNYRQQLRDIPQTYENPFDVVFPEKPSV